MCEREPLQAQRKAKLTGAVAHDLNDLLSGIIGMTQILLRDLPEEAAELRRVADLALQAAQRGTTLAQQLLAFSRVPATELLETGAETAADIRIGGGQEAEEVISTTKDQTQR